MNQINAVPAWRRSGRAVSLALCLFTNFNPSGAGLLRITLRTILLLVLTMTYARAAWFDSTWKYRVPVSVPAGASVNSTIKVDVDFSALLATLGVVGTFDVNSPRVVRPNDSLATTQEFTDVVYASASDAANNGRGEVRFLLQDAGPATYYLYFDIVANGPKAANPQNPINGNFEQGVAGTQSPSGWTATKTNNNFDAQVRPSETPNISSDGSGPTPIPNPVTTDGTPYTGTFSYLLGARTNNEAITSNPSVTLTRSIAVPSTSPGNLVIRYRLEGWDSSDNGATQYDFLRISLVGSTTTEIVGPTAGNYTTYPFSPNKGTNAISATLSGYGRYNYWDIDTNITHNSGMTLAAGSQPWFTRTYALASYAGQTITLRLTYSDVLLFKSWAHIDDVEWSVVAATLGTPEAALSFNYLRIEHAGIGVTCAPTTLTIKACADALCGSLYSGGVTGTLTASGTPIANWVGGATFAIGASGLTTKDVQVTTAGTVTWGASGVAPVASSGTACYVGGTASCSFTSALAGLLFDVPNHYSNTSQTINVNAVKQADNSLACAPAFASTSKTINFGCAYTDPATGTLPVVVGGGSISCGSTSGVSLNFNASGVATTTVRYADVGQMTLTASYAGSSGSEAGLVMTGTDTFIAAPASFTVAPTGPYAAGNPFSVTVTAKNATGGTTPNFGKESTTENVVLTQTLVGPAGGNNPPLSGTTTLLDAAFQSGNGVATTNSIAWGEVGDISMIATLASGSYLGTGLGATGNAAVGPFKPAYFDTVVTPGTGTFTYSGQPFGVTVTAKNASGTTTQNYKGSYAKTVTLTDANSATNNSTGLGSLANASIAAASFSNGVATVTNPTYTFTTKTTAPLEAPTTAPLKLRATDTDGVTSNGHAEGTTAIRGGRLRLVNFYGSNLLKSRVEYRAEYWDGNRWATNTLDTGASATSIVAGNIATGGLAVSALTGLNAGVGYITFNTAAAGSYDIALDLNASGVDTSCNAAHAGAPANKRWLQGYWSTPANCGGVAAWAQDPNARIRLGSPRAPYIYLRERY